MDKECDFSKCFYGAYESILNLHKAYKNSINSFLHLVYYKRTFVEHFQLWKRNNPFAQTFRSEDFFSCKNEAKEGG